jgi:hypothetical protein
MDVRYNPELEKKILKKHGRKLNELELDGLLDPSVFDMCPALNVVKAHSLVSPFSFFK